MRIYLDDDTASADLIRLLRNSGHNVQLPRNAGLSGVADPVRLCHSIRESRVVLTGDYADFRELHD